MHGVGGTTCTIELRVNASFISCASFVRTKTRPKHKFEICSGILLLLASIRHQLVIMLVGLLTSTKKDTEMGLWKIGWYIVVVLSSHIACYTEL